LLLSERSPISAIAARAQECGPYLQAIEAKINETSVTIDGVRPPFLEFGPPKASEAAVFVHGNPGSNRDWQSLARGVGQFGRAVAMDMPGFGAADKRKHFDYSVPGYASGSTFS
jgi:pimeloyl-ACP methyl ester carboxylesterase